MWSLARRVSRERVFISLCQGRDDMEEGVVVWDGTGDLGSHLSI